MPLLTDTQTGITAPIAARVLGAAGATRNPWLILVGDGQATADQSAESYRADAAKLFGVFHRNLPSGTFARLVVEYLRDYRKNDAKGSHEPDRLDRAILDVVVALGERFSDHERNHEMNDRAGE